MSKLIIIVLARVIHINNMMEKFPCQIYGTRWSNRMKKKLFMWFFTFPWSKSLFNANLVSNQQTKLSTL